MVHLNISSLYNLRKVGEISPRAFGTPSLRTGEEQAHFIENILGLLRPV